jgi:hypothetical protein
MKMALLISIFLATLIPKNKFKTFKVRGFDGNP